MRKKQLVTFLALILTVLVVGCAGGYNAPPVVPLPQSSAVSLTMRDAPPSGISILSFQVLVTGVALNPGNIDLLEGRGPVKIEVKRLEIETAFLSTATVATGTYTSVNLVFGNPELTFKNDSGTAMNVFGVNCPNGTVCQVKPAGTLTAMVNFPVPGLTIAPNNPIGLRVDVNLANLVSTGLGIDFSARGAISVTQSQLQASQLEEIEEVLGKVANKSADAFDLQIMQGTLTGIKADASTQFEGFTCNPVNVATCVQNGQIISADLRLLAGGMLLAKKIEREDEEANEEKLEGIIVSMDVVNNKFQMALVDNVSALSSAGVGALVTVT